MNKTHYWDLRSLRPSVHYQSQLPSPDFYHNLLILLIFELSIPFWVWLISLNIILKKFIHIINIVIAVHSLQYRISLPQFIYSLAVKEWVVSSLGVLLKALLWTFWYMSFGTHPTHIPPRNGAVGSSDIHMLNLGRYCKFSKELCPFTLPSAARKSLANKQDLKRRRYQATTTEMIISQGPAFSLEVWPERRLLMACGKLKRTSWLSPITDAKRTLIPENTCLSHSPKIHGNQAEQFYYQVAERKSRSGTEMPALRQPWAQMDQWQNGKKKWYDSDTLYISRLANPFCSLIANSSLLNNFKEEAGLWHLK